MSRYFQTLKKLQQERGEEPSEMASLTMEPSLPDAGAAKIWAPESPEEVFPELPLAHREAAWSDMIEALRSQSQSSQTTLVVAGVSEVESTRRIVAGLLRQADRRGLLVRAAQLTISRVGRVLRVLPPEAETGRASSTSSPVPEDFELSGHDIQRQLQEWLRSSLSGSDLLVIEAPGVLSSTDTLLLAKACDGLALVVEPLVTDRKALKAAVDRARTSDCRIMGLVVSGHREWLPRWLRRLLPD